MARAVAVPTLDDVDPGQNAFGLAEEDDELAADRAASYRLQARRVVRDLRRSGGARIVSRVIAIYDGAETALRLIRWRLHSRPSRRSCFRLGLET